MSQGEPYFHRWGVVVAGIALVLGVPGAVVALAQLDADEPANFEGTTQPSPSAQPSDTEPETEPEKPPRTTDTTSVAPARSVRHLADGEPVRTACDSFYFHDDWPTPMALNGRRYLHVLSAGRDGDIGRGESGPCRFEYNLSRNWQTIRAKIGVSDKSDSRFSCIVEVVVDGSRAFTSREVGLGMTESMRVDVRNALRVKIIITFLGPGYGECALGELRVST